MSTNSRRGSHTAEVGFTLIHTLISVAAVSVLGAILLARLKPSPQITCASNMRRLGLGLAQYVQDNDQCFPPKFFEGPQGWAGRIYPYVKSAAPYKCPDDLGLASGGAVPVSYGINANLIDQFSKLKAPASTVMLFEVGGVQVDVRKADEGSNQWKVQPASKMLSPCGFGLLASNQGRPYGQWGEGAHITYATGNLGERKGIDSGADNTPRHGGGSNFLGADGHVSYLLGGQVSSGTDGRSGNAQDHLKADQAAATDQMYLSDGATPVQMTFSTQ
ncbi:hypothetical protein CCAX7_59740 [Capsulimonas corticalis]|uniref:Uncharacterized protein n=1 Tax=Capsulimonas corticalis TaxID=2219043 RepID=A0A402CZN0_9BACT|nr:type II secretion system protein [Capsulimonas corticalis]BDI33923.1 hypothetical protein CCAX7_59740 [Capsulimonas corticalis]